MPRLKPIIPISGLLPETKASVSNSTRRRCFGLITFFVLFTTLSVFAQEKPGTIASIKVQGNYIIQRQTILHLIKMEDGDPFSPAVIQEDIKRLYRTEFFDDIKVDAEETEEGIVLTYIIIEKPVVKYIEFVGNKAVNETKLRELLTLKENDLYRQSKIRTSIEAIKDKYREEGYNDAVVELETNELAKGSILVTFHIYENAKVIIKDIIFENNEAFSDRKLRWDAFEETKRWWLFGFISGKHKYIPANLDTDLDNLSEFYKDHGYIRFKHGDPEIEVIKVKKKRRKIKKKITITIPVDEGQQYRIGDVDIENNILYDKETLFKALHKVKSRGMFAKSVFSIAKSKVKTGEVYSQSAIKQAIENISTLYARKGYIYTNVFPIRDINDENLTVDVTFDVTEGSQAFLRRLEFKGNERTRDKVLRREMLIEEQDAFDTSAFRESMAKLFYLGFIENIEPDVRPDPDDESKVDVTTKLSDEHRTQLQFTGGFSTTDKFIFSISLSEFNFLGLGQELKVSATAGRRKQIYSLSFSDPYVFDTRTYGSAGIYNTETSYDTYSRGSRGASATVGWNLSTYSVVRLGYRYEIVKIFDIDNDIKEQALEDITKLRTAERALWDARGKSLSSIFTTAFIYDRRDNRRDPSKGVRVSLSSEYSGNMLGGDNHYYKWALESSAYIPLIRNLVFAAHAEMQYADSFNGHRLPVFEYFYLGGELSIRGTGFREVGPLDENLDPIGGNKSLLFNFEFIIPFSNLLKLAFFFDMGDVFAPHEDYDLKTFTKTAGIELRFLIPSFWVPIRFIWGYNLDAYSFQKKSDFQFGIGTVF